MNIKYEIMFFLIYIFIGFVISFIFDIFRATRKARGKIKKMIYIDDILFFLICSIIIILANVFYTREMIRVHLIISIFLGIAIYIAAFGNSIMNYIFESLTLLAKFWRFIILPIEFQKSIFKKSYIFFEKFVKKCCNILNDMLIFIRRSLKLKTYLKKLFKNKGETNEN